MSEHELVSLTKELIRFRSMRSRPDEIQRCADFIAGFLEDCGVRCERIESQGVPSVRVLPRPGFAPILLMAHFDVVDAPEALFEPREEENLLYGRGSIDDKYAVALCLVLVKHHLARLKAAGLGQEALPFGILLTGDEEIGGYQGAAHALTGLRADFAIALDGGRLDKIVIKEKGLLKLKLIARGRAAHGARPWLGENAIEKLIADYQNLRPLFQETAPDHWHKTLNFSIVRAGESHNQVPPYAEAVFDIRYTEHDDVDALLAAMRAAVQGELVVEAREPLFNGGESPYLARLRTIVPLAEVGFEHGASDARFLSDHGIPGIVWGADGDQSAHALDEHLRLDSLFRLYADLDTFVRQGGAVT